MEETNHRADENRREQPNLRQMESGEQGWAVLERVCVPKQRCWGAGELEMGHRQGRELQNSHFSSGQVRKLQTRRRSLSGDTPQD